MVAEKMRNANRSRDSALSVDTGSIEKEPFEHRSFKRLFLCASGVRAQGAVSVPVRIALFSATMALIFSELCSFPFSADASPFLCLGLFFPVLCRLLRKMVGPDEG